MCGIISANAFDAHYNSIILIMKEKIIYTLDKYSLLIHIPLSMAMIFIIEWMARHSFMGAVNFVHYHFGAFLYNSYLVYVTLLLTFLIGKHGFMRDLVLSFFLILGVINGIVLLNRVSPFGFTDINMVGDLLTMQNTNYFSATQGALSAGGLTILTVFLVLRFLKGRSFEMKLPFWARLLIIILAFISIPFVTKALQNRKVISSYFGNLAQGYADNGFLYGFSTSAFSRGMHKPLGYSEAKIDSILEETRQPETTLKEGEMPNIVVVLLESCFDVSECSFIETSEDATPYLHSLEENYSTGHCIVPVVGAGTCNSEFEVLTGMSVQFFGPGEYPQKTVLKDTDCESIASNLSLQGYGTHVVHNNGGNFYSRKNAFSMMGFDTFQSKEMLDITDYTPMGSWPKDEILIDATSDAMDITSGKDFIYTITVSTHGDYPTYAVEEDPVISVNCIGKDEETNYRWLYYVNRLKGMDDFVRDYVNMFKKKDEPTLLIMFGDHLPTMGLTEDEISTHNLYYTKYYTWNNFGMEKEDMDLTTYQLVPEFLDRLGIHGGTMVDYNQTKTAQGVEAGTGEYMTDLEMLQYDILYGNRYVYGGEDGYPASDIVMGVHDIKLENMFEFNEKLHLYGDNFTKWSKVFVNGEKVTTSYESGQVLTIDASELKDGDEIVVNQMGSSNTVFRSSNTMIYHEKSSLF